MAYARGQERLVSELVLRTLKHHLLTSLGWDGVALGRLPWGATVAPTIQDDLQADPKTDVLAKNTVGLSEGRMPDDEELQMGGGLDASTHTFFVDIYGETRSITKALAGDVRSIFTGRAPGARRVLTLPDYSQPGEPVLPGHLVHFEDVEVEFPDGLGQTNWAVVKLTAIHEFNP